jgi:hypothetical protein
MLMASASCGKEISARSGQNVKGKDKKVEVFLNYLQGFAGKLAIQPHKPERLITWFL